MTAPAALGWSDGRVGLAPIGKAPALPRRTPNADIAIGPFAAMTSLNLEAFSLLDRRVCAAQAEVRPHSSQCHGAEILIAKSVR